MRSFVDFLAVTLLLITIGNASAETINYTYDAAGRLTHAYYPDGTIEYVYDPAGNLLQRIVTAGVSPSPIEPSMVASKSAADLVISYSAEVCASADHVLFVGALGSFENVSGAECSIGSSGNVTIPLPGGSVWFLVAGVQDDRYSSVGGGLLGERLLTGVGAFCPDFVPDTQRSCP